MSIINKLFKSETNNNEPETTTNEEVVTSEEDKMHIEQIMHKASRMATPLQDKEWIMHAYFNNLKACISSLQLIEGNSAIGALSEPSSDENMRNQMVYEALSAMCGILETTDLNLIREDLASLDVNVLMQGLKACMAFEQNSQEMPIFAQCREMLVSYLTTRIEFDAAYQQQMDFEKAQFMFHQLIKEKKDEETLTNHLQYIAHLLVQFDELFVVMDQDYAVKYPFIGADARIDIFTSYGQAQGYVEFLKAKKLGNTVVEKLVKEDYANFFGEQMSVGIQIMRINNGTYPVELGLGMLINLPKVSVMERANVQMRNYFLREMQYGCRVNAMGEVEAERRKNMIEATLTMRMHGYRELANACLFVIAHGQVEDKVSYYSKPAYDRVTEVAKRLNASLVNGNDEKEAVYEGEQNFRVGVKKADAKLEEGMVYAFTSYGLAKKTLDTIFKDSNEDFIMSVTFEELLPHANQCNGILLDHGLMNYEISKDRFNQIEEAKKLAPNTKVKLEAKEEA